ncbi:uncharacterized protein LOC5578241 isoform X2 [Aedes aegypti]|uniref:Uncharacterized protein n=1 Tax=Aedes aegypti TaxID=7159 RepID=A0A6I8TLR4_AEDAE|nr:uncharacterized protein LOC5578241 isoform X2 [Aedes aegypti]
MQTSRLLCFLFWTSTAWTDIRIYDLTNNPIAIIPLGQARISNSYIRVIHPVNLTAIKDAIDLFDYVTKNSDLNNSLFDQVIRKKINKIHLTFNRIVPQNRFKRWESLGRAWKYVSGSPDADDLKVINSTINSLVTENNNQIHINNVFEKRMRNLTRTFNLLIDNEQKLENVTFKSFDSLNFVFELDELLYYLEVVEESITLARSSIPNSRIIHERELEAIQRILNGNGFGLDSVDSILNIASAYVMFNKDTFIYILKIPRIKNVPYTLSFVEPVIAEGYRIHLPKPFYLKGKTSFISQSPCSKLKALFVCSNTNLEPLTECMQQLISGETADCPMERIYRDKTIRKVNDGNIVIHGDNITLRSNCSTTRFLSGSYLIQHSNCTLNLDDEEYTSTNLEIQPFTPVTTIKSLHRTCEKEPRKIAVQPRRILSREAYRLFRSNRGSRGRLLTRRGAVSET